MRLFVIAVVLLALNFSVAQSIHPSDRKPTQADIDRVLQAIQDEIYDYGFQEDFGPLGTSGEHGRVAHITAYIDPVISWNSVSWEGHVIYKYPPFGEVRRGFFFGKDIDHDRYATLGGDPGNGFSWTRPDTLTLYLDDDEVCSAKHDWTRALLEFDLKPSASSLEDAYRRQKQRTGQSHHGRHSR